MTHRLAIIIPAYKATFLPTALDSIAAQTCKDFTLYVGDDCSPEPIGDIVGQYRKKIELVYQRFDTNLGGKDLVAQWERCVALSQEEPYVWLFSDDDVMEPNCVEALLRHVDETNGAYDVYHFDVNEINDEGEVTKQRPAYPQVLGAYDYYKGKTSGKYRSYVVENVFSRRVYEQAGGFKNFDLAWGSDVATWCIFCGQKGMSRVPDAKVCWRRSAENITPNTSGSIAKRKMTADCHLLAWAFDFFGRNEHVWKDNRRFFISVIRRYRKLVSQESIRQTFKFFFDTHGHKRQWLFVYLASVIPNPIYKILRKKL